MPEDELIDHHFGLGAWIRRIFNLWERGNTPLLADCQGVTAWNAVTVTVQSG